MNEELYDHQSKERLTKSINTKIDTTMIGALASIEKYFGYLWGEDNDGEPTKEQQEFEDLYEQLRTEILDRGNHQKRLVESEIQGYNIRKYKYNYILRSQ